MKSFKYTITGKKDQKFDNSLLNPKKIKARKQKIKEIEEEESDKEIKEILG